MTEVSVSSSSFAVSMAGPSESGASDADLDVDVDVGVGVEIHLEPPEEDSEHLEQLTIPIGSSPATERLLRKRLNARLRQRRCRQKKRDAMLKKKQLDELHRRQHGRGPASAPANPPPPAMLMMMPPTACSHARHHDTKYPPAPIATAPAAFHPYYPHPSAASAPYHQYPYHLQPQLPHFPPPIRNQNHQSHLQQHHALNDHIGNGPPLSQMMPPLQYPQQQQQHHPGPPIAPQYYPHPHHHPYPPPPHCYSYPVTATTTAPYPYYPHQTHPSAAGNNNGPCASQPPVYAYYANSTTVNYYGGPANSANRNHITHHPHCHPNDTVSRTVSHSPSDDAANDYDDCNNTSHNSSNYHSCYKPTILEDEEEEDDDTDNSEEEEEEDYDDHDDEDTDDEEEDMVQMTYSMHASPVRLELQTKGDTPLLTTRDNPDRQTNTPTTATATENEKDYAFKSPPSMHSEGSVNDDEEVSGYTTNDKINQQPHGEGKTICTTNTVYDSDKDAQSRKFVVDDMTSATTGQSAIAAMLLSLGSSTPSQVEGDEASSSQPVVT